MTQLLYSTRGNRSRRNPIVFMFSGQGSQYFGMGRDLFAEVPAFARRLRELDAVAQQVLGTSVLRLVHDPRRRSDEPFDRLLYSSVAIVSTELALVHALRMADVEPDIVLGTSLGEFVAAGVAGAVDEESLVRITAHQSGLAETSCPNGGMIAVLHDVSLAREPWLAGQCEIAAINFDSHFVVSAAAGALEDILAHLKRRNIAHQRLPVRHPFHSSLIEGASAAYKDFLKQLRFESPRLSFVSSVDGAVLRRFPEQHWWRIVRQAIRFQEAIAKVEAQCDGAVYLDLGPSGTLAAALLRLLGKHSRSRIHALMGPLKRSKQGFDAALLACGA